MLFDVPVVATIAVTLIVFTIITIGTLDTILMIFEREGYSRFPRLHQLLERLARFFPFRPV